MPIEIQQLVVEPMPDLRPSAVTGNPEAGSTTSPATPLGSHAGEALERAVAASARALAVHRLRLRAD